jgi:hypothetical protein
VSEPFDAEQSSVVYMGRDSFRMQIVDTPAPELNDDVPRRASETPTDRIYVRPPSWRLSLAAAGLPEQRPAWSSVPVTRGATAGLCLAFLGLGIVLTSAADRFLSRARLDRGLVPRPTSPAAPLALPPIRPEVLPPVPTPPPAAPVLVDAPADVAPAAIAPRAVAKPAVAKPTVAKPPVHRAPAPAPKRRAPALETASEPPPFEPAPEAVRSGTKWVDPFAD